MIQRALKEVIGTSMQPNKVMLVFGARRVGKTVLIKQLIEQFKGQVLFLNGEDASTEEMFSTRTASHYRQLLSGTDLLVIDEAQNIPDIGKILKLIVDEVEGIHVLVSGSSSFDLRNQTGEPLVGRSTTFRLSSLSVGELLSQQPAAQLLLDLDEHLVYGGYPELLSIPDFERKQVYLSELAQSYLLKDILTLDGIKNSGKMFNLLRLVAFQMGSEVSYEELGRQLALSRNTVEKYLDLLTKTFVIYRLPAYSRNPRKEVSKAGKWYFYDNGIRNAIIGDFRPLALRQDVGALWENFLISERIKMNDNLHHRTEYYFWRTYSGQEIDLIEERNGEVKAFEFKWGNKNPKVPASFKEQYPDVSYTVVTRSNFVDFCTEKL
ncbi:MAG: ATP-binding protein [Bacteroidales bacterium]|nr:ATP-binding protein [Bacteroidales bacterium]MBR6929802.1 ATP-binding protein [Bacteroidales bacterium]